MIQKGKLESIESNYRKHPEGSQKVLLLESSLSNNQLSVLTPLNFPQPETTQTFWTTNWAQIFSRTVRFFSWNRRGWKSYSVLNNWKASEHPLLTPQNCSYWAIPRGRIHVWQHYVNSDNLSVVYLLNLVKYRCISPFTWEQYNTNIFLVPCSCHREGAEQYDFHILLAAFYCCFPISSKMSLR